MTDAETAQHYDETLKEIKDYIKLLGAFVECGTQNVMTNGMKNMLTEMIIHIVKSNHIGWMLRGKDPEIYSFYLSLIKK